MGLHTKKPKPPGRGLTHPSVKVFNPGGDARVGFRDVDLPADFRFSPIKGSASCESSVDLDSPWLAILEPNLLFNGLMVSNEDGRMRELKEPEGVRDSLFRLQFEENLIEGHVLRCGAGTGI
jgi:hypothetical protein